MNNSSIALIFVGLIFIGLLAFVSLVGAVDSETMGPTSTPATVDDSCQQHRIAELRLAADPNNLNQAAHMQAAEAFGLLAEEGMSC